MNFSTELKCIPQLEYMEFLRASTRCYRFPTHCHSTFVIQLIEEGADWCCSSNLVAKQGDVFVHFPMTAHSGGAIPGKSLSYSAIYPSSAYSARLLGVNESSLSNGKSFVCREEGIVHGLRKTILHVNENRSANLIERTLKSLLNMIVDLSNDMPNELNPQPGLQIQTAGKYLTDHLQRDVTVQELAQKIGLSRFQLIRGFKKHLGITPRQYLISQRVASAKQLLTCGMSIVQVAASCGFDDQSHLTRCFKRVSGYSPGVFAKQIL